MKSSDDHHLAQEATLSTAPQRSVESFPSQGILDDSIVRSLTAGMGHHGSRWICDLCLRWKTGTMGTHIAQYSRQFFKALIECFVGTNLSAGNAGFGSPLMHADLTGSGCVAAAATKIGNVPPWPVWWPRSDHGLTSMVFSGCCPVIRAGNLA